MISADIHNTSTFRNHSVFRARERETSHQRPQRYNSGTLIVQWRPVLWTSCCDFTLMKEKKKKIKQNKKMWQLALTDHIDAPVALSAKTRRGNANSQQRGRGMPENVFVMHRFLGSHVAVSSGRMCERALCLRAQVLGFS